MKKTHAAAGLTALAVVAYMAGHGDGESPAPAGQPPESARKVGEAKDALLGYLDAATGLGQGVIIEGGEVLAVGGNAASGAGNGVATGNTVPGAPPR